VLDLNNLEEKAFINLFISSSILYKMSGPGPGKKLLGKANVYIHEKGKSGASVTHIDIELPELNDILKPGEASFVGAKEGGVFIGLKKEMIKRAEKKL